MKYCTWHLMPARLHAQVSGSQKPWQSHPQASLESLRVWSCLFSSLSMCFTPAARRTAWRCLEEYGWRKHPSSSSVSLTWMSTSLPWTWSAVSLAAFWLSIAPLVINWNQRAADKMRRLLCRQAMVYISNQVYLLRASVTWTSPLSVFVWASLSACAVDPVHALLQCTFGGWCDFVPCQGWHLHGWARWWSPDSVENWTQSPGQSARCSVHVKDYASSGWTVLVVFKRETQKNIRQVRLGRSGVMFKR